MLYVFQHFKCIDLSFQLEELKQKQAVATALNSGLKLNIATLSRPGRIDQIARRRLGLTDPAGSKCVSTTLRAARKWLRSGTCAQIACSNWRDWKRQVYSYTSPRRETGYAS